MSKVLNKLAFFKTHVGAIWYNKLANKTLKTKLDEIDYKIYNRQTYCKEIRKSPFNYKQKRAVPTGATRCKAV